MRRAAGERGQVAGIEALPFGLLIFVAGTLLLVNMWGVVDTKFAADASAREAARYVVESAGAGVEPWTVRDGAQQAAERTFADHGKQRSIEVDPPGATIVRCERVTVRVSTVVPAIRLPFFGGYGDGFDVVATHSELVDPTRSGVDGRADCIQ
jgi:hypothetical protein